MPAEYKCVPCPRRPRKSRDHKSPCDALAAAMEAVMNEQAAAGWTFVRTDLVPMEHRAGLFGGVTESHQAVMVFSRERSASVAADAVADIPRLGAARIV
jgi:hypothetical protein